MTDDRVIRLLEEVRDLQREHLEHYKEALRNQTESIRMQRELHDTAKSRLRFVSVLIAIVPVLLIVSAWGVVRALF